jgi:hypothetical protein
MRPLNSKNTPYTVKVWIINETQIILKGRSISAVQFVKIFFLGSCDFCLGCTETVNLWFHNSELYRRYLYFPGLYTVGTEVNLD